MRAELGKLLDMLAYLVVIGSKPLPYIFAALIAGWTVTSLEIFDDDGVALLAAACLAIGASLVFLPPLLWVKEKADHRIGTNPEHCVRWLPAQTVGMILFILFVLLLSRYA